MRLSNPEFSRYTRSTPQYGSIQAVINCMPRYETFSPCSLIYGLSTVRSPPLSFQFDLDLLPPIPVDPVETRRSVPVQFRGVTPGIHGCYSRSSSCFRRLSSGRGERTARRNLTAGDKRILFRWLSCVPPTNRPRISTMFSRCVQ